MVHSPKSTSKNKLLIKKSISGLSYDLVICFIDLDDLKHDYPRTWKKEVERLNIQYPEIIIIWQINKLEDEFKKVLGEQVMSKYQLNKLAKEKINDFINSDYWKRILLPIKNKEKQLTKL